MTEAVTFTQAIAASGIFVAAIGTFVGASHRSLAVRLDRHRQGQDRLRDDLFVIRGEVSALKDHVHMQNGRIGRTEADLRDLQVNPHAEVSDLTEATTEALREFCRSCPAVRFCGVK